MKQEQHRIWTVTKKNKPNEAKVTLKHEMQKKREEIEDTRKIVEQDKATSTAQTGL